MTSRAFLLICLSLSLPYHTYGNPEEMVAEQTPGLCVRLLLWTSGLHDWATFPLKDFQRSFFVKKWNISEKAEKEIEKLFKSASPTTWSAGIYNRNSYEMALLYSVHTLIKERIKHLPAAQQKFLLEMFQNARVGKPHYDPQTKKIVKPREDVTTIMQSIALIHEFDHAVQDTVDQSGSATHISDSSKKPTVRIIRRWTGYRHFLETEAIGAEWELTSRVPRHVRKHMIQAIFKNSELFSLRETDVPRLMSLDSTNLFYELQRVYNNNEKRVMEAYVMLTTQIAPLYFADLGKGKYISKVRDYRGYRFGQLRETYLDSRGLLGPKKVE